MNQIAQVSFKSEKKSIEDKLRETFYQCRFSNLIEDIDKLETTSVNISLLKTLAQYELNLIPESKLTLSNIEELAGTASEISYVKGMLSFFDSDMGNALSHFNQALVSAEFSDDQFKALLGLANIHVQSKEFYKVFPLINELSNIETDRSDLNLSFLLLCSNSYFYSEIDKERGISILNDVLKMSLMQNKQYFVQRCLYYKANYYKKMNQENEMMAILDILKIYLETNESKFLMHLTNQQFESFNISVSQKIEINKDKAELFIGDKNYSFSKMPLPFKLITLLFEENGFISKNKIAEELWPLQVYKPRTHDPRIYDIVKRIRKILETFEKRPLVMLSSHLGYKLAK